MNQTTYSPSELQELDRAAEQALDRAVRALLHPDEQIRRKTVRHFMKLCDQFVCNRLLDRLIGLLSAADESVRMRAAAALVDAGGVAVNLLIYRLGKARKLDVQLRLAKVVACAGRQVDPLEAMIFRPALELVRRKTPHEEVRTIVSKAIENLGLGYGAPEATGLDSVSSIDTTDS